ncbi:unnamed protein product [Acidithrix sp. C25]|nr:unnamed protein product [Acidithrix sp. C25]
MLTIEQSYLPFSDQTLKVGGCIKANHRTFQTLQIIVDNLRLGSARLVPRRYPSIGE